MRRTPSDLVALYYSCRVYMYTFFFCPALLLLLYMQLFFFFFVIFKPTTTTWKGSTTGQKKIEHSAVAVVAATWLLPTDVGSCAGRRRGCEQKPVLSFLFSSFILYRCCPFPNLGMAMFNGKVGELQTMPT